MPSRLRLGVVLSFVLGSAATFIAPVAMAGDAEIDRGGCGPSSSTAYYKLKVSTTDNSRLNVSFAVFSDDLDEWDWKLLHNDDVSARGGAQARDADRSFRVVRRMIDAPGVDEITFRTENTVTGEVCRGVLDL
ncbi:hypothetical protein BH09ACT12_BH09ACT12_06610 [soil metagenome]